MSSSQTVSFIALPRELRDRIYDELFYDTDWRTTQDGCIFFLWYGKELCDSVAPKYNRKLPLWLLSSRQIFHEAREQYYRKVQLVDIDPLIGTGEIHHSQISNPRFLDVKLVNRINLTGMHKAHLSKITIRNHQTGEARLDLFRVHSSLPYMSSILSAQRTRPTLHNLRMEITLSPQITSPSLSSLMYSDVPWRLGVNSPKECTFKRIEFVLQQPLHSYHRINQALEGWLLQMYTLLLAELERVAKELTVGPGWVIREWIDKEEEDDGKEFHLEIKCRDEEGLHRSVKHKGLTQWIPTSFH